MGCDYAGMTRSFALIAAIAVVLTGCGGEKQGAEKYTQTWRQSYESTTCAQWGTEMTAAQRWAASADMLVGARQQWGITDELPSDDLVDTFEDDLTDACVIPSMTIGDVGTGLALTERAKYDG